MRAALGCSDRRHTAVAALKPGGIGDRGPLPVHLIIESKKFTLMPHVPAQWVLSLSENAN